MLRAGPTILPRTRFRRCWNWVFFFSPSPFPPFRAKGGGRNAGKIGSLREGRSRKRKRANGLKERGKGRVTHHNARKKGDLPVAKERTWRNSNSEPPNCEMSRGRTLLICRRKSEIRIGKKTDSAFANLTKGNELYLNLNCSWASLTASVGLRETPVFARPSSLPHRTGPHRTRTQTTTTAFRGGTGPFYTTQPDTGR